jgi:hypothetical protein
MTKREAPTHKQVQHAMSRRVLDEARKGNDGKGGYSDNLFKNQKNPRNS